jgi:protein involved in polysaccharide export with SLBB domain
MNKRTKHQFSLKKSLRSLIIAASAVLTIAPAFSQQIDDKGLMSILAAQQGNAPRPTINNQRVDVPRSLSGVGDRAGATGVGNTQQMPRQAVAKPGPFENYVESVTGKELKIFGRSLFEDVPTTFAPLEMTQVNPDYVIGPGDGLQIRGWGMVDIDVDVTVDRNGSVTIPRVGNVKVAGVKYRDLQGYLTKAVARVFNNFELTVSVSQTRALQIYVVGHAMRPGTYTLSAMSTLLNALFTSGGPDASGSMRRIQLKRGNEVVTTFDMYDMLVKGDKTKDAQLRDGDVIYIPEAGPMMALSGNVKQPAIFELTGSSSLADVIGWAGGFDSSAEGKPVIVEKSVANAYHTVAELPAEKGALSRLAAIPVGATDIVRVFAPGAIPVQIQTQHEFVRVSGEIKNGGVFEIRRGETLRELISRLGGVTDNGYLFAIELQRDSVRRSQQARLNEVAERFEHEIDATAADRLSHATDPNNIAAINADIERQRRLAERMREVKAKGRIVLELGGINAQVKDLPDVQLQDGDSVFIPRKPGTVDVVGAVFLQSAIIYRPNRTVSDYLSMAGGPTADADKDEIYLIRADGSAASTHTTGWLSSINSAAVNPGDAIIVPEKVNRNTWTQSFKEWTTILYQFGLGAAGLKVLKD